MICRELPPEEFNPDLNFEVWASKNNYETFTKTCYLKWKVLDEPSREKQKSHYRLFLQIAILKLKDEGLLRRYFLLNNWQIKQDLCLLDMPDWTRDEIAIEVLGMSYDKYCKKTC